MNVKIQIVSDLHLELYKNRNFKNLIQPVAPILALLGDIGYAVDPYGRYRRFLEEASVNFENVIIVSGNHEYYGTNIIEGNNLMYKLVSGLSNVYYLNDTFLVIDGIIIYGTTLWSSVPKEKLELVFNSINDYHLIHDLTVRDTNRMHKRSINSLNKCLSLHPDKKFVVLTHHAPSTNETSSPLYKDSDTKNAFASNLEHMMYTYDNLVLWAHGHTHWNNIQQIGNTTVSSNQKGHPIDDCDDYDPSFVLYGYTEKYK